MQFKNYFFIFVFISILSLVLATRLLYKNNIKNNNKNNIKNNNKNKAKTSVFAEENFEFNKSEEEDDLMELKIMAALKRKISDHKSN